MLSKATYFRYAINFTIPNSFGAIRSLAMSDPSVGIAIKDLHFRGKGFIDSLILQCVKNQIKFYMQGVPKNVYTLYPPVTRIYYTAPARTISRAEFYF